MDPEDPMVEFRGTTENYKNMYHVLAWVSGAGTLFTNVEAIFQMLSGVTPASFAGARLSGEIYAK